MEYHDLESPEIFSGSLRRLTRWDKRTVPVHTETQAAGFNNIKLLVDLNAKVSFP